MKLNSSLLSLAAGIALLSSGSVYAQAVQVDPALPTYQKAAGVSGNFTSVGSDTLNNLMTLWAEEYKRLYPT